LPGTAPLEMNPVTRFLMVCDTGHKTYSNIKTTGRFVICIPHASQVLLVRQLGSVSGHEVNKIEHFKLHTFISHEYKYSLLYGCIAYLECMLDKITNAEGIIIATVASARADKLAFRNRFLVEKEEGKTLHHLGGEKFMLPGDQVIE
jgi:flavin reductase (DIM6/NTAB) family NADH-FMN oxidoreductase RutF